VAKHKYLGTTKSNKIIFMGEVKFTVNVGYSCDTEFTNSPFPMQKCRIKIQANPDRAPLFTSKLRQDIECSSRPRVALDEVSGASMLVVVNRSVA
jgi:hypothetical protein